MPVREATAQKRGTGTRRRAERAGRSIPEEIGATLLARIFRGKYQPGDSLTELGLSGEFGVSQAVVREALSSLAHAGLVRRIPNKGTLVAVLSERDAAEHTRVRTVLETIAAADAAATITRESLDRLAQQVAAMTEAAAENDYYKSAEADLEFHREIWRAGGDRTLYRLLDQVTVPLFAFVSMNRSWRHSELRESVIQDHHALISALRSRDPEAGAEAMRRHFRNSDARSAYAGSKLLMPHLG